MEEKESDLLNKSKKTRYDELNDRIYELATRCNHDPSKISMIVVSKSKPFNLVKAVIIKGCKNIGESYVEEALEKISAIDSKKFSWQMSSHRQSRKTKYICGNFDWAHSLDHLKTAGQLNKCMQGFGKTFLFLQECNVREKKLKYWLPTWDKNN